MYNSINYFVTLLCLPLSCSLESSRHKASSMLAIISACSLSAFCRSKNSTLFWRELSRSAAMRDWKRASAFSAHACRSWARRRFASSVNILHLFSTFGRMPCCLSYAYTRIAVRDWNSSIFICEHPPCVSPHHWVVQMLRVPNCSGFIVGNAHIIPEYALYESFARLPPSAL